MFWFLLRPLMQLKCKAAVWDKVISKFDLFAAGKITAEQKTANMDLWTLASLFGCHCMLTTKVRCTQLNNSPEMPTLLKAHIVVSAVSESTHRLSLKLYEQAVFIASTSPLWRAASIFSWSQGSARAPLGLVSSEPHDLQVHPPMEKKRPA